MQDGTLAGADLDLATALRNLTGIGVALGDALAMAGSIPAGIIGRSGDPGHLRPGGQADFVHLDPFLALTCVRKNGRKVDA